MWTFYQSSLCDKAEVKNNVSHLVLHLFAKLLKFYVCGVCQYGMLLTCRLVEMTKVQEICRPVADLIVTISKGL